MASMSSDPMTARAVSGKIRIFASSPSVSSRNVHLAILYTPKSALFCLFVYLQGAQEVSCVVDKKSGDIILSFESCQMNEGSQFIWKKDYEEITEFSKGVVIKTESNV